MICTPRPGRCPCCGGRRCPSCGRALDTWVRPSSPWPWPSPPAVPSSPGPLSAGPFTGGFWVDVPGAAAKARALIGSGERSGEP